VAGRSAPTLRPDRFLNQEMLRKEGYAVSQLRLTK
jgi:hypothetical protein